jgi:hypothetical protein
LNSSGEDSSGSLSPVNSVSNDPWEDELLMEYILSQGIADDSRDVIEQNGRQGTGVECTASLLDANFED